MKIAIVGTGITGISTALELARDGHQVTVFEQRNAAAEDASFAPGGWLTPLAAHSLTAPGLGMPLRQLQKNTSLLQASGRLGSPTWRWMRQWKKNEALIHKHGSNPFSAALHAMGQFSDSLRWQHCEDSEALAERKRSTLILLRTPQEASFWSTQIPALKEQGVRCELLNAAQAQELEPGLGQDIAWLHALHFPDGESINPRLWAQHLRLQAQELGVAFHTGMDITRIHYNPVGVEVNGQLHPFEHVVICTGAQRSMLTACGIALPLMSIWGYSVTAPVRDPLHAPRSAIMDWEQQATICRMGQRVRITAGLEMGSTPEAAHHQPTLQRMYHLLNDWFPGGVQLASAQTQIWRGARGYLPDGLPAVGASQHPGIWLNVAHGSHGISLAAGCARALADMLAGHDAAVDMQAFSPLRF